MYLSKASAETPVGWAVGYGAADHGAVQTVEVEMAVVADVVALAVEATAAAVLGVEGLVQTWAVVPVALAERRHETGSWRRR